jgi:hypothetical protein
MKKTAFTIVHNILPIYCFKGKNISSREHDNEPVGSIKGEIFLAELGDSENWNFHDVME